MRISTFSYGDCHHTVHDCILSCLQVVIETTGVQNLMLVIGQYRVVATYWSPVHDTILVCVFSCKCPIFLVPSIYQTLISVLYQWPLTSTQA